MQYRAIKDIIFGEGGVELRTVSKGVGSHMVSHMVHVKSHLHSYTTFFFNCLETADILSDTKTTSTADHKDQSEEDPHLLNAKPSGSSDSRHSQASYSSGSSGYYSHGSIAYSSSSIGSYSSSYSSGSIGSHSSGYSSGSIGSHSSGYSSGSIGSHSSGYSSGSISSHRSGYSSGSTSSYSSNNIGFYISGNSIFLMHNEIGSEGAVALAEVLKNNTQLQTLKFGVNHIDDSGATALAESFQYCTKLQSLNLSFNHITDRGALALAENLKYLTDLREVDLKHNRIGDEGAIALTKAVRHLTLLLQNHKITQHGIDTVLSLKSDMKRNLDTLTLSSDAEAHIVALNMAADHEHYNNTAVVNVKGVTEQGAEDLVTILQHSSNIKTLNFGHPPLFHCLCHCTNLLTLNLENNCIGNNSAIALADSLKGNSSEKLPPTFIAPNHSPNST